VLKNITSKKVSKSWIYIAHNILKNF